MNPKLEKVSVLSIGQPWAECILHHGKNVENRNWPTNLRGYFAIHATAKVELERFDACKESYRINLDPEELQFGAIVGFAELVDVVTSRKLTRDTKKWFSGKYGFVLENVIRLKEPVPAKGSLGFWKLKGAKLEACMEQLSAAQRRKIASRPLSKPD